MKARRRHNFVSRSTIYFSFPFIRNMFQRFWQKERNAIVSCEAFPQNGGINSPREGTHHLRLGLYKGAREHWIMLWFVVNCDLQREIVVFLPCTYSCETGISNLNQTGIYYLILGPENLADFRKVFSWLRLLSILFVPFEWLNMLFLEFYNWFCDTLNSISSQVSVEVCNKEFRFNFCQCHLREIWIVDLHLQPILLRISNHS
jgi:hypothetical protein